MTASVKSDGNIKTTSRFLERRNEEKTRKKWSQRQIWGGVFLVFFYFISHKVSQTCTVQQPRSDPICVTNPFLVFSILRVTRIGVRREGHLPVLLIDSCHKGEL